MSTPIGGLLHVAHIQVRWGDMDALGHVNNAYYLRYMEQARVEWLTAAQVPMVDAQHQGPILVTASCTYLVPIVYPADLDITLYGGKPGRSSFDVQHILHRPGDLDSVYAEGLTKVVWFDHRTGKSAPVPEHIRRLLPP